MAKHCTVCNEDYPDNLAACPRCATAKKTKLASRSEERTTRLAGKDEEQIEDLQEVVPSDSAVNLGGSPEEPAESGFGVTLPEQEPQSPSDVAMASLMAETDDEEPAAAEQDVDDMLAEMEETPEETVPQEPAEIAEDEEAVAPAEMEEVAEPEEEKPAKAPKPRSNIPALAGTTLLGILLGVGGTIGARSLMGPGENEKRSSPLNLPHAMPQGAAQAKAAPTFETLAARVANGDWDEAKAAGIEDVQGANPKELATLGDYRLMTYLTKAGNKINPNDPALTRALQDLQKAAEQKEPNAIYDLALIKELAGQLNEARAEYAKGAQAFANDPGQKQRFEWAIHRVESKAAAKAAADAAHLPQRPRMENRAALLALLLIALQQPPAPAPQQPAPAPQQPGQATPPAQPAQPAAAADNKEAGFEFWNAVKQAQAGKLADAVSALDRARKLHDQVRFTRLRKAQNPISDPAEDIFLRCCDELRMYWQLEKQLRDGGYLTDKNTPSQAIQALAEKAKGGGAPSKELMDKLAAAQKAQMDAENKTAGLEKQIQSSKTDNTKLAGDLKTAQKTIEERQADLTSAKKELEKLKGESGTQSGSLKKIRDELVAANLLAANDKANVGDAVRKMIAVAKTNDPQGMLRRQHDEIEHLAAALAQRWQPAEMLPVWLLLLDENRNRAEFAGRAMRDAQRVLTNPQAPPALRGEAEIVLGLALRNTERFSEAKTMLAAARGVVNKEEWLVRANAALKEVSDPAAYFALQAQELYDRGLMETALDLLTRRMKALPAKDQGKLLAQRSLIELDAARAKVKGPLPPTEPLLIAAQTDAEASVKAGAPEGHYAAGRIAETLGQVDAAVTSYRAALAGHSKLDSQGSRYRMALARALLLPHEARPAPSFAPQPKPVGWVERSETHHARGGPRSARPTLQKHLVLMLTLGLQPPLLPGEEPGLDEAEKLADEVLKAPPGTVPFPALAQALAVKGRWSLALQVYVEGIRPMLPREYYDGLVYLLTNDPRLRRPDSLRIPNPLEAEKHFAAGLNFYFDGDYLNAEKSFLLTIMNDSQDARFFYFLGLSRLALHRRRDAYADFGQGALLERLNRPASPAVDETLERIQGPARFIVNEFRQSPEG